MSSPPQGAESHSTIRPYWIHRERISLVDPHPGGMPDRLPEIDPNRLYRWSSPTQQPASSLAQPEPAAPAEDYTPPSPTSPGQSLRETYLSYVPATLAEDTSFPRTNPVRASRVAFEMYGQNQGGVIDSIIEHIPGAEQGLNPQSTAITVRSAGVARTVPIDFSTDGTSDIPTPPFQTSKPSLSTFLTGHLLPLLPSHPSYPPPGTTCVICQDPFHTSHAPVLIINTPHCVGHIFGYRCFRKSLASGMPNSNKCPLCRTKWFDMWPSELRKLAAVWDRVDRKEERTIREEEEAEAKVAWRVRREEIAAANAWLGDVEPDDVDRAMTLMEMVMIVVWFVYDISVWLYRLFVAACVIICFLELWASREAFPFWRRLQEACNVDQ